MASGSSAASIAQERDAHSEPINFRAALAAFEQNSSTHAGSPGAAAGRTPQTPARPSGGSDPIARSASTPHNRAGAASNNPFSAANAAALPRVATGSIPATSASGMLSAPSPAVVASTSPSYATGSTLRKSDSGLSLRELMNKSLPRSAHSPVPPSRSRSGADDDSTAAAASASASGRSTPAMAPRAIVGLFAEDPSADALRRTASPASSLYSDERAARHMLDTSLDEQDHTHPMFAHAVMPRSTPGSPERKGSTSSTASASSTTPRLPPRPTQPSLAPSPTLTEFGQLQPAAKDKAVGYATYTPGFKRGVATIEVQRTPPALPPRSATLGQSERGKSREPPSVPKKPLKPAPPPRPTAAPRSTPDSAAKAFRFGSAAAESTSAQPAPPPRPSKPSTPGGTSLTPTPPNTATTAKHRKSGSNVFTSISLSDEASSELRRTLETDVRADVQLPPPARGRPPTTPHRTATASTATGGVVSSLIGTAASALPLFKASTPLAAGARSLADGAPSKQYGLSRSGSTHSDLSVLPGHADAGSWMPTRAVQLADAPKRAPAAAVPGWWKMPDPSARARYDALFTTTLADQARRRKHARADESASNASTLREKPRTAGVQALRGWFESDAPPAADMHTGVQADELGAASVRRVWKRSRLPARFLAQVWDYAVHLGDDAKPPSPALGREAFVCALATIDAELARRRSRRQQRTAQASDAHAVAARETGGRRVPPPPRA